jgi:hypothetical protein
MFSKGFSFRSIGIMKPEGVPGSSVTAIGVGLFVAFGGILFGLVFKQRKTSVKFSNEHADMTPELLEVLLPCLNG